jgi:hypothetical protein
MKHHHIRRICVRVERPPNKQPRIALTSSERAEVSGRQQEPATSAVIPQVKAGKRIM